VNIGIDIGSTTAKVVITSNGEIVFSEYKRHKAQIAPTLLSILQNAQQHLPQLQQIKVCFTGSAGMGIAENFKFNFTQEVIAASEVIQTKFPSTKTLIDIGGEDAKIIFFEKDKAPDIRMNGSCAGGTGAFIDQIAALINTKVEDLNELAQNSTNIYPIASRCGVFAKTDVQNLISRKIPTSDIAASAFHAIALQVINSLSRGVDVTPKVICVGGPLTFIPSLRKAFQDILSLPESDFITPEFGELFPAWGAAMYAENSEEITFSSLTKNLSTPILNVNFKRLPPLFSQEINFDSWQQNKKSLTVPSSNITQNEYEVFLGIDSGSTTTKTVMLNAQGELIASHYGNNLGKPVEAVITGIEACCEQLGTKNIRFLRSAVTGYGEDLVRAAFTLEEGIVETIAHTTAAQKVLPNTSFIIDIGGQDMKAIFIKNGAIQNIEINEACSSGCGSFIQNFAESLSYNVADFGEIACQAENPCDLGSRCTVFMNSQVKQSLKEGASISEISAGLAYAVVKNALFKVLRIKDMSILGDHIMVQGGTFKNPSVFRAMEQLTGKSINITNKPELMGALGAAYYAQKTLIANDQASSTLSIEKINDALLYTTKQIVCRACTNNCVVTKFVFHKTHTHFSGNKCEKVFSSKGKIGEVGENLHKYKYDLLFDRNEQSLTKNTNITIGIPRILGMYSNYPFWNTLLTNSGFNIKLSAESTYSLFEKGQGTIMADNICFPAKLAHGHIIDLVEQKVDRIFYPMVIFEQNEHSDSKNSFNCPIVSSYGEVLDSAIPLEKRNNIPIDKNVISFKDENLLKKNCWAYVKSFGVKKSTFEQAFKMALLEQKNYKEQYRLKGFRILERAKLDGKPIIMLAGRPYHSDPLVHQKTSDILTELGACVITEEIVNEINSAKLTDYLHVPQWNYPNRILKASQWVINNTQYNIHFVQLNSFGCGPDSFISDEIKELFEHANTSYTFIRVDEINSTGSMRLRLRSLIETIKVQSIEKKEKFVIKKTPPYLLSDKQKQIIGPFFTQFHTPFISPAFELMGYKMDSLPVSDKKSVELGLQYANNEVCYPATLIIGDIIKALQSGQYDPDNTVVVMSQTGGQCRASNYLALIKKAILQAGFENTPVISLAAGDGLHNEQPGFEIEWKKILRVILTGAVFGDILSRMHFATIVREKVKGATQKLTQDYLENAAELARKNDTDGLIDLLKQAVIDYNNTAKDNCTTPQIGIVGEIYLKYNPYANMFITDWLVEQGIEVRMPDLLDFFVQEFVNMKTNSKNKTEKYSLGTKLYVSILEQRFSKFVDKLEKIGSGFKYYHPKHSIYEKAELGAEIVDLANQYGEGWLIPAEIALFAKEGVNNVVSLQPFGCIANHIVAKGVEKKIKTIYPKTNLLFLDYDGGTSEVNIFNRLHFLAKQAKDEIVITQKIEELQSTKKYNEN